MTIRSSVSETIECPRCKGTTRIDCPDHLGAGMSFDEKTDRFIRCKNCGGTGRVKCPNCGGSGTIIHCK